jgi:hypothetical protein
MEQAMETVNLTNTININPAILPLDELRQLVVQIILRDRIEPFVQQMVALLDSLKTGQTGAVAKVAGQSIDPAFVKLMSALSEAVQEGELVGARNTALLAAGYAYQESLDYYRDLMSYLDRFREPTHKQT